MNKLAMILIAGLIVMSFEDFCEVVAVNGIKHTVNCQGELFVVNHEFEIPVMVGDSVYTEFKFKDEPIDVKFIDMTQPQEMEDRDE